MRTLNGRLLDLVGELDRLGKDPTLAALGHAMQRVKLTPADVAAYVHATPRHYNRVPVVVREAYDLLVMTWLPGQASVPHDHSGSICAMQVVQGEAVEGCYHVAADSYVDLQYETALRCGEVLAGQDAGVHSVRNSSPTGELLVTVHVYSPPLRDIRQFRPRPAPTSEGPRQDSKHTPTIVIVGGGFSGAMAAAQTLRRARQAGLTVKVVLVERRGAIGEGLAYSTGEPAECSGRTHERLAGLPG
jgi:predicted metal-dependent enzyme (double-stranded beta helix superfamily)